jgi:hypothetical protein
MSTAEKERLVQELRTEAEPLFHAINLDAKLVQCVPTRRHLGFESIAHRASRLNVPHHAGAGRR